MFYTKNDSTKIGQVVYLIVFVVVLGVFLLASIQLFFIFRTYHNGAKEYEGLKQHITKQGEGFGSGTLKEKDGDFEKSNGTFMLQIDFEGLKAQNNDCIAWIHFDTIDISYPLMQGEDNEYYLKHTFNKEEIAVGSIFMDWENASDFTNDHTIIYGHNMKDGSMFAQVNRYKEKDFFLEHPDFWIYTPQAIYRYEIFSCYLAEVSGDSFDNRISTENVQKEAWIERIGTRSEYATGVPVKAEDKIVTLVTCNSAGEKYRFVVHAKQTEKIVYDK
ncbi:class B sortase [Lachnospiraceae bacterium ZAX-1]